MAATVHSDEGLNDMVYNRCVGTRYCSNNCPYKVRRFNFLLYSGLEHADAEAAAQPRRHGPQPRRHGEVHLLRAAHQLRRASRPSATDRSIRDGEVLTACQSACPTEAIVFGNLNDPDSRVTQLKDSPRNYSMLEELNTRPRTTYLAAVRNPNPALPPNASVGGHDRHATRPTPSRRAALMAKPRSRTAPPSRPRRAGDRRRDRTSRPSPKPIAQIPLSKRTPLGWVFGFLIGFTLLSAADGVARLAAAQGHRHLGQQRPRGWAFDIINFVWWIGIGHAGTLISAILLLFKQQWRMSISRFAEAMTIFAVLCAAIFPIFHTGRPWLAAYWLFPYPNTMGLWPQFRSPLIWDVFAVSTYATVSVVFWYVGLIPDLATMRDRATSRSSRSSSGSSLSAGADRPGTGTATK